MGDKTYSETLTLSSGSHWFELEITNGITCFKFFCLKQLFLTPAPCVISIFLAFMPFLIKDHRNCWERAGKTRGMRTTVYVYGTHGCNYYVTNAQVLVFSQRQAWITVMILTETIRTDKQTFMCLSLV